MSACDESELVLVLVLVLGVALGVVLGVVMVGVGTRRHFASGRGFVKAIGDNNGLLDMITASSPSSF